MSQGESESLNFKISPKQLSEGEYYITARAASLIFRKKSDFIFAAELTQ